MHLRTQVFIYDSFLKLCEPFFKYSYLKPSCFCTGDEKEDADLEMPKVYEPITSFECLMKRLNMFLTQYNETIRGTGMDMVFFQDAMIHLIKVL